jgi:oligopeptide/dipeptide ABC transporter ATP-binding protein
VTTSRSITAGADVDGRAMQPLISLNDVRVTFQTTRGSVAALRGVHLEIPRGEIFGVVGESGCGKSVTGRAILRLLPSTATVTGSIRFNGLDLTSLNASQMRAIRGDKIGMVFQDPGQALNPVFTVGAQLQSMLGRLHLGGRHETRLRALALLSDVGLPNGDEIMDSYPFQLSGGMQQRAMIAIALAGDPDLLIADEPTTALDVTIQAQILELLGELQAQRKMTVMLITHDIGVIARVCRNVAVFYAGRVVESGSVRDVLRSPRHPYTEGLLASLPTAVTKGAPLRTLPGIVPSTLQPIVGCSLVPRCPYVHDRCRVESPETTEINGTRVECWLYGPEPLADHQI